MAIVNFLGHHPSTTELGIKKIWKNVWFGIIRRWGNIEKFREEYGIDKPPVTIHPNTLKAWKEQIIKKKNEKQEKMNNIVKLLKTHKTIHPNTIVETLGYSPAMLTNYINDLLNKKLIKKQKIGTKIFYSLDSV
jgi:predicted transcriptional regulator